MNDFTIVLQAGGKSTRMGMDKATVPFLETTLLGYILDQVRPLSDDIILVSNDHDHHARFGLPMYADIIPDWGALGGVYTAVHSAARPWCLLLACDMPFVSPALIGWMAEQRSDADAVIPRISERDFTEPFRSFYHKRCLAPIETAIQTGQRRVDSFFGDVRVRFAGREEVQGVDPQLLSFFNVNTPEELREAEQIAKTAFK